MQIMRIFDVEKFLTIRCMVLFERNNMFWLWIFDHHATFGTPGIEGSLPPFFTFDLV